MSCCNSKKVKQIVTGWARLALQPIQIKAKERLKICRNCASNRWGKLRMWCNECHCYIPAKVRVTDAKCDLDKW